MSVVGEKNQILASWFDRQIVERCSTNTKTLLYPSFSYTQIFIKYGLPQWFDHSITQNKFQEIKEPQSPYILQITITDNRLSQ